MYFDPTIYAVPFFVVALVLEPRLLGQDVPRAATSLAIATQASAWESVRSSLRRRSTF
jgi:hypothetical protein